MNHHLSVLTPAVTVKGKDEQKFRGFLLEARGVQEGRRAGRFLEVQDPGRIISCSFPGVSSSNPTFFFCCTNFKLFLVNLIYFILPQGTEVLKGVLVTWSLLSFKWKDYDSSQLCQKLYPPHSKHIIRSFVFRQRLDQEQLTLLRQVLN